MKKPLSKCCNAPLKSDSYEAGIFYCTECLKVCTSVESQQPDVRVCSICRIEFPLTSEFWHSSTYPLMRGFQRRCIKCNKENRKRYYWSHRDKEISNSAAYVKTPVGKKKLIEKTYRMIEKYPEKYKCRNTTRNAVKKGLLVKTPCVACGNEKVQAHHNDYTNPLDVIWFCMQCHKDFHRGVLAQWEKE